MASHVLQVGDVRLAIDTRVGARATVWEVDGLSLLHRRGSDPVEYGMYPMAPWAGRLRDNAVAVDGRATALPASYHGWALHGTVLDAAFEAIDETTDSDRARLSARSHGHPGWPWPMAVEVEWDLRPRVLRTTITVHALQSAMPAVLGWHPWFARQLGRGGPLEWSLDAERVAGRGTDHLPDGSLRAVDAGGGPYDDAFLVPDGRATVRWPGALALDIRCDSSWYVVYDELADAACVEPQSGPPDGVNDGLGRPIALASPGSPLRLVTVWSMRDDPPRDRDG